MDMGGERVLERRIYNGHNQLLRVIYDDEQLALTYRPDGLRHRKVYTNTKDDTPVTTTHHWDGQNIVMDEAGGRTLYYLRGINLIARMVGGARSYYTFNAHGDVVLLLNAAGAAESSYSYDAFGNTAKNSTDRNPFRYCGEYYDFEKKEYYLRARTYDPANGRFSTEDAIEYTEKAEVDGQSHIDPLSLNRYTYVQNNPVRYEDPSGLLLVTTALAIIGIGALIGAIAGGVSAQPGDNLAVAIAGGAVVGGIVAAAGAAASAVAAMAGAGALATGAIVGGTQAVVGGIFGMSNEAVQQSVNNRHNNRDLLAAGGRSFVVGLGSGFLSGSMGYYFPSYPDAGRATDALINGIQGAQFGLLEMATDTVISGTPNKLAPVLSIPNAPSTSSTPTPTPKPPAPTTGASNKGGLNLPPSPGGQKWGSVYTVQPGDSFWAIAASMLGDGMRMYDIAAINGMDINSVIHPGMVLKIPF